MSSCAPIFFPGEERNLHKSGTGAGRAGSKYALIDGKHVVLPGEARFYFQDKRGCWFWSSRKPRIKDGDWTPNKTPVQISTAQGYHRCLITPASGTLPESWRDTVMRVINLDNMPLAITRTFSSGLRSAVG